MPIDIETSIDFVKNRAEKTAAAQRSLAPGWVWPDKTVAQWEADALELDPFYDGSDPTTGEHTGTPSLANTAKAAEVDWTRKLGIYHDRLATIHRLTVQAVNVMRGRAKTKPSHAPVVNKLAARGDSAANIQDEAAELLAAWKVEFGVDFVPAEGNTYEHLRALCNGKTDAQGAVLVPSVRRLSDDVKDAAAVLNQRVGRVNALLSRLEDDCVNWYSEATAVFAAGTPEGDMIRGTVPTSDQYAPGAAKPATNPADGTTTPAPPTKPPTA